MIKFFIEYYLDKFDSDFGIQEIEVDSDCINKAAWVEAFRQAKQFEQDHHFLVSYVEVYLPEYNAYMGIRLA